MEEDGREMTRGGVSQRRREENRSRKRSIAEEREKKMQWRGWKEEGKVRESVSGEKGIKGKGWCLKGRRRRKQGRGGVIQRG